MSKKKKVPNVAPTDAPQKNKRLWEKGEIKNYFVRLFGKYDFRNEKQFLHFIKWLMYVSLVLIEILLLWQQGMDWKDGNGRYVNFVLMGSEILLLISEGLRLFALKGNKSQTVLFVLNVIAACLIVICANGIYPVIVYMLILSELYVGIEKAGKSLLLFLLATPIYVLCYVFKRWTWTEINVLQSLLESLGTILALTVHFIALQIALAFYRQYLRLGRTLQELDESKKQLEKAYAVVAEVTALEERQRIAKEIHDTAGHSITTVIMQTEAAKRIVEDNPEEAKIKIVAANLQAKHALEELRDSVHLLSGTKDNQTLQEALENIIHDSTDGTGIKIRSEIEDVTVSETKYRFLCNTLKEGISNGLRHGNATAFWFELKKEGNKIHFLLSDNGAGAGTSWQMGFGLTTMRDRAKTLGGEIFFDSHEEGFELRLIIPTDAEE